MAPRRCSHRGGGDAWVSKVRSLSGEEPAVLQAALDRTLRDLAVHQEDTAGLAAVHLVQALGLVSVGAQEPEAAGPAQQRNGAHAEPGGGPSGRPLLALSEAPPVTPSGQALARDDSTTADANDGPLLALPGSGARSARRDRGSGRRWFTRFAPRVNDVG